MTGVLCTVYGAQVYLIAICQLCNVNKPHNHSCGTAEDLNKPKIHSMACRTERIHVYDVYIFNSLIACSLCIAGALCTDWFYLIKNCLVLEYYTFSLHKVGCTVSQVLGGGVS